MTNEENDKTMVRTRRMPFRPAPSCDPDQSVNVLPVGTHLGEFEVLDLIGEGGFGIVYLAYDHSLERHVALKEYMPSGLATRTTSMAVTVRSQHNAATFTAGLKSFINEARMLAQFDSPSLVKVHRFWEGNGTAYMVMPFYEGITLKRALKERRITPSEPWIRLLLADLFDAIDTIHRAQCLHRDIAPDNILLLKDGRPLLLDFGAARRVIGDLTQCLTVILKPGFAPIEQYADIAGLRQGAWTDIYALAAVVYFLITGKAPPPAVARMVHDELVPAREAGKGRYSPGFLAVLDKALSVKPEQRFRSIEELRRALDIMETVPRTLPRVTSQWDTTAVRTTRIAEQKPNPQPAAKAEEKHATVPPVAPGIRSGSRPRTEPRLDPDAEPEREAEPAAAAPSDGKWQQAWGLNRAPESGPQRDKPAWMVLGLLLTAGIASGVYLGTHQPWRELSSPTTTASSSTTMQSSGSSEVPEEETASQASANASPPAPAASTSPAPAVSTPARAPQIAATDAGRRETELPASNRPQTAPSRPPSERELWKEADASDISSAYEKYLDAYPKGRHAAAARRRLESRQPKVALSEPSSTSPAAAQEKPKETPDSSDAVAPSKAKPGSSPDEEDLWKTATGINAAPAYEAYLNVYPSGRYAPAAKDKLASIKRAEQVAESPPAPSPAMPKPQATEQAKAPVKADKLASIKPSEPGVTSSSTPTPAAAPKPEPRASGKKTLTMEDNTVLTGDFTSDPKTGLVSGTGKVVWTNGNQYEGTLVRGKREGQGKFLWTNGQRYSGEWARDMPNGKGTIVFADGSRYEGEVKDGVPHGHGTTRFKSGDVYSGDWVRGKSQGQGRYTWANGSYWEGEFRDDKRTDNGKLVFSESALQAARDAAAARSRSAQEKQGAASPMASETR